ncbi:hypothetical protein AX15_005575 [Amanita polypyramis BW_CC]|nr:hypothetical protein AX15_005575 [Amanita polypyramis BW_CC]
MKSLSGPHHALLLDHIHADHRIHHQVLVKTEDSASPDLSPVPSSLHHFQLKFHPPQPSPSHASNSPEHLALVPSQQSLYRFGSNVPCNFAPTWSDQHHSSAYNPTAMSARVYGHSRYDIDPAQQSLQYSEDYDEVDLTDLPLSGRASVSLTDLSGPALLSGAEKQVRRRSSKACDQCRKSKCKCERSGPGEACKSCITLNVACTFLGPSRKRGPPKGYIDAIEARLHQTEALLGIIIASNDSRAQSLLRDLAKDPLAKEIISRVDNTPYGVKGRNRDNNGGSSGLKTRFGHITASNGSDGDSGDKSSGPKPDLTSTHPSNEWQDEVGEMLRAIAAGQPYATDTTASGRRALDPHSASRNVSLRVELPGSNGRPSMAVNDESSPRQRQRRRIESDSEYSYGGVDMTYPYSAPTSAIDRQQSSESSVTGRTTPDSLNGEGGELTVALGQLSMNEEKQLRYHGKASGLYLLSDKVKSESRNEGGIWRFPKGGVWPALPSGAQTAAGLAEHRVQMPEPAVQQHLLDLYFAYVHPSFPVIQRDAFDLFKDVETPNAREPSVDSSTEADCNQPYFSFNHRHRSIPPLLLFAMFAVAARYEDDSDSSTVEARPTDPLTMWDAGDDYFSNAKIILDGSYVTSRPSTCQALLLMGYREVGIGAMAQAWTYIGMAIRMAQDLGMHRSADEWARADLGGKLFGKRELNERKRIWYGCVIMDKYVSTYIGRPLMIFDRDFDTLMPDESDPDEWTPGEHRLSSPGGKTILPVSGHIISCFNASASLSNILGKIVEDIYAVRPQTNRYTVLPRLEGMLDRWYLELPEHLRFDLSAASARQRVLPSHVLTLHMQYWCAVLLLHRALIRQLCPSGEKCTEEQEDREVRSTVDRYYELCSSASHRITTIVSLYQDRFPLRKAPVFFCYYVFTASVMHATSVSLYPEDPQARVGLARCMEVLLAMQTVWPSAGRALELMNSAKTSLKENTFDVSLPGSGQERVKRSAAHMIEEPYQGQLRSEALVDYSGVRHQQHHQQAQYLAHQSGNSIAYASDQDVYAPAALTIPSSHQHQHPAQSTTSTSVMENGMGSQPVMNPYLTCDRWVPPDAVPLPGPLSTSVLPQVYSTGLVDDVVTPGGDHMSSHTESHAENIPSSHGRRQSQYWNDYSTYSQLAPTYGDVDAGQNHSVSHSAPPQQMYMSGQYNMYS